MVEVLVNAGTDINAQNRSGDTALHRAAALGRQELVEKLLKVPF